MVNTARIFKERLAAARGLLTDSDLDGLLISCPENRRYLSGFTAMDSHINESSGCLLLGREMAYLLTDFRYRDWALAEAPHFDVQIYTKGLAKLLPELLRPLEGGRIGFESPLSDFLLLPENHPGGGHRRSAVELAAGGEPGGTTPGD